MRHFIYIFCFLSICFGFSVEVLAKKSNSRVTNARKYKNRMLKSLFAQKKMTYPPKGLFFRAFKKELIFEVWAQKSKKSEFKLIKSYPILGSSGELGPKRVLGDLQIPEGFYKVIHFNPWSSFHLSFKINYPNKSDRFFSKNQNPGGDIFIHGEDVSIGCLAMGNDAIREIYLMAFDFKTKSSGNTIPVYIYPFKMREKNLKAEEKKPLYGFWKTLLPAYDFFENYKQPAKIKVDKSGLYKVFKRL